MSAQVRAWIHDGVASIRETGENPCAAVSNLGRPSEQLAWLREHHSSAVDVDIPVKLSAFDGDENPVECEATLTIAMLGDEEDHQWEAFQVIVCGYPSSALRITTPPF